MLLSWVELEPEVVLELLAKEAAWVRTFGPLIKQADQGVLSALGHQFGGYLNQAGQYVGEALKNPHVQWGLGGAGLGGAAGLASELARDPEDRHPLSSALTGAMAGGVAGLGGSMVNQGLHRTTGPPEVSRTSQPLSFHGQTIPAGVPEDKVQELVQGGHPYRAAAVGMGGLGVVDAAHSGIRAIDKQQTAARVRANVEESMLNRYGKTKDFTEGMAAHDYTGPPEGAVSRWGRRFFSPQVEGGKGLRGLPAKILSRRAVAYPLAAAAGWAGDAATNYIHHQNQLNRILQEARQQ